MQAESIFCKYCKAKLTLEPEINQGFHHSCEEEIVKEKNLSLSQVFDRLRLITNGDLKVLPIDSIFMSLNKTDYNFDSIDYLEKNSLYIAKSPQISYKYLYLCNINKIPFELSYFSDLQVLKIKNDFSIILNDYLSYLSNLIMLDLEFKESINGIEFLSYLKNLISLSLAGPLPEKYVFPDSLSELKNLQNLKLESFDCFNLIDFLQSLPNLRKLTLSFGIINEKVPKFDKLEELSFINIKFLEDISELYFSHNLKKLYFSNSIVSLSEINIQDCSLEEIIIQDCSIKQIPISLSKVLSFKTLKLLSTNIKTIPFYLNHITTLQIDRSQITEITDEIVNLSNLVSLSITHCQLNFISKNISFLKNLKVLNLSSTEISEVPDELKDLTQLQVLNISNNNFDNVPDVICYLKQLKILILDNNRNLTTLPDNLSLLKDLNQLSIKLIELSQLNKQKLIDLQNLHPNLKIIYY